MRPWIGLAAINGLVAVGFAAYGAHGVSPAAGLLIERGSQLQLVHAVALLAIERLMGPRQRLAQAAGALFVVGMVLFSGSLYAKAIAGPLPVPLVTPAGGIAFMLGWAVLAVASMRIR
jgi:uncharacterized membrane protein YgdD (TMEM256/DUF423 family)